MEMRIFLLAEPQGNLPSSHLTMATELLPKRNYLISRTNNCFPSRIWELCFWTLIPMEILIFMSLVAVLILDPKLFILGIVFILTMERQT